MTTTQLPPLPAATYTLTIVADSGYESTTEGRCNVQQYSAAVRALHDAAWAHEIAQARADLEAENKRLREALQNIKHMKTFAIETTSSWCPLATEMVEIARAALEKQP